MGDWANLPTDIMILIIQCLQRMDDVVALGLVCKSWQKITSLTDNMPSLPPRAPIVLLYPAAAKKLPKCYPRIATSCEFKSGQASGRRFLGTCRGWLLTAHYKNSDLNLLHPFPRQQIDLPSLYAFKDVPKYPKLPTRFRSGLVKLAMSGNPLDKNAKVDCVILVTHSHHRPVLAFARIGDQVWTSTITPYRKDYQDVVHYKGVFYVVDDRGALFICNINSDNENAPISITAWTDPPHTSLFTDTRRVTSNYLVKSSGDLLLVSRLHMNNWTSKCTTALSVYNLESDEDTRGVNRYSHRWKQVQNLGGRALFVGANASVSVHPSKHVNADCVYFYGDDFHAVRDSWVYNTTEKNIESLHHFTQLRCPKRPLWYF